MLSETSEPIGGAEQWPSALIYFSHTTTNMVQQYITHTQLRHNSLEEDSPSLVAQPSTRKRCMQCAAVGVVAVITLIVAPGTRWFTVGPWWVRDSPESPGVTFPEHGRGHSGTVGVQGDSGKGPECDTAGPLYRTAHIDRYIYTGERKSQILK